jgi:Flp pilus assembly protein TadG
MRISSVIGQARTFIGNEKGSFAVMSAAIMAVLTMSAGFAINIAQLHNVRSNLGQALDAAVTSTARDITTGKIEAKDARDRVELFLSVNTDGDMIAGDRLVLDKLIIDKTNSTVEATAYVDVDLYFPLFGLSDTRRVSNASAAVYSDKKIEVAMMLDVTGSMGGKKIKDLKSAANNALDAFLAGQDKTKPRVRVAIVPYANAVNTGALSNVVFAEKSYTAIDVEPPALYDPIAVAASLLKAPDKCATERKGTQQFTNAGPDVAKVNRDYRLDFCPNAVLQPLSADIGALKSTVSSFSANGYTGGHIGIQWTWYMLSNSWKDVLPKDAQPLAYDKKKVAKYAILMTDGEFNTAYAGVPIKGNPTNQASLSRSNAERLCDAMRKDGIEIFSVGFQLKEAGAKGVMKNCANTDTSSIRHYYEASTGDELNQAFLEIAHNIERLAITK